MDDKIYVTVYCLTYNHEKYIADALKGFVSQKTNFRYKVIVHDDCSTDKTASIIKEYAEKYPNIIKPIFEKENLYSKKVKIIKNVILPLFEGKYIAACEGDDYWTDCNKLQLQVDFLDNNPEYSACVHDTVEFNCRNGNKRSINGKKEDYDIDFSEIACSGNSAYQLSSLMCRREHRETFESDDRPEYLKISSSFGDFALNLHLIANGKIRYLAQTMSVYRLLTPGSWTSTNSDAASKKANCAVIINTLSSYDKFTKGRYHQIIVEAIQKNEFKVFLLDLNISKMKSEKYIKFWKMLSKKERIKVYIKKYIPFVYSIHKAHNR